MKYLLFLACLTYCAENWVLLNDNDPSIQYSGFSAASTGTYYNGDMHWSNTADAYCLFQFTGTGVRWIGAKNSDHGKADVYLDDSLVEQGLDSYGSAWLTQQLLFERIGLKDTLHSLKIVVKNEKQAASSGYYQDIDAFGMVTSPLPPIRIGATELPTQVPYFGRAEPYTIGNGITAAGGDVSGAWDFLIGPDYSCADFITREALTIVIDNTPFPLSLEMHRARKTGLLYGCRRIGDLNVYVLDFAVNNLPCVIRLVRVQNASAALSHEVAVRAAVSHSATSASIIDSKALSIRSAAGSPDFGGEDPTWADRFSLISFNDSSMVSGSGSDYTLETTGRTVAAGNDYTVGLYHWQHYAEARADTEYVNDIRLRNVIADAESCMADWFDWVDSGKSFETDTLTRDAIEGAAVFIKMQQDLDGGYVATMRRYAHSYIRDSHAACRGLMAMGHTDETRRFIQCVHRNVTQQGYVCNSWPMNGAGAPLSCFVGGNSESELPAYYALIIRNYLEASQDTNFVDSVRSSIEIAIDAQVNWARSHGWRLRFNGDETERYVPSVDGATYGDLPGWDANAWSFASMGAAIASVSFYVDYLGWKGETTRKAQYQASLDSLKASADLTFWRTDVTPNRHEWSRKQDNSFPVYPVPNFDMLPFWLGARLEGSRERDDALNMLPFVDTSTGFMPVAPDANQGLTGHALGYLLYALAETGNPAMDTAYNWLINNGLRGCWGTWTEFYGPHGTPNGHNLRVFETGINLEAITRYLSAAGDTTNVENKPSDLAKACLSAYPNPFNPEITIELPDNNTSKTAELKIFDIRGKCVQTLTVSGKTKAIWNGKDSGSGVFIVMVSVNGNQYSRKIIKLK